MACKYIFNGVEYKDKQTFIEEFVKPNFINQPKTLRLQELQQPDFLKFIRKDKDYLKSQGLTDQEVDFLNLLFAGDEKWTTFFIKSVIQDATKKGYEKVLFPSGNTASKVEGHTTLEEFKKEKEYRLKKLEKELQEENENYENNSEYDNEGNFLGNYSNQRIDYLELEINQLKQELERVETEGFGALKPIYNFYENTVTNILNKTFGKENVNRITDEYGNTWNEIDLTAQKVKEQTNIIKFQSPDLEYKGDLAIEEKIAEMFENTPDEDLPKTLIGQWMLAVRNFFRNVFKERSEITRFFRDINQGKIGTLQNDNESRVLYQKENNEGIIASEKTIRDLAARMSDRIGIPVKFESDRSREYKGKIENNIAYINLAYATLDTPIHEILGHPIIRAIKMKSEKTTDSYIQEMIDKGIITKEC
jgi:hypothetical protein